MRKFVVKNTISIYKYIISYFNKNNYYKNKYCNYLIQILLILIFIFFSIFNQKLYYFKNYSFKKKDIKVCLCVMGKEENLYAKEFINHYKQLGYNHIFLYDNNNINGEKFEDVLKEEISEGFVSIINFRGKKGKIGKLGGIQLEIYYHCYENNNKKYDWLSFFDFDEFLVIKPKNQSIQNFLYNKRYNNCDTIKINFLYYSDNEHLYYSNKSVQERFRIPLYKHYGNKVIKSTIRGNLKENYWKKNFCAHTSLMKYRTCDSTGNLTRYNSFIIKVNFSFAYLKHYYTKSVEEYCHKIKRGEAFYNNINYTKKRKLFKIKRYFSFNKKTKEKMELFKKLLNLK